MDSGAYPASKKNTDLDIDKYIDYVNEVGDYFYGIAQLDYIPRLSDGSFQERTEKSMKLTWERFLYMWERVRPELRKKLIYIIHEEDTETCLRRALEWRDERGEGIGYMGLGLSITDKNFRDNQLQTATKLFKEYGFKGNCHGFGVQVLSAIQMCPYLTTCDSSSAIRDQMTGKVFIKGDMVKISDDTAVHHKSELSDKQKNLLEPELRKRAEEMGIDYDLAKVDAGERYIWGCRERSAYIEGGYKDYHLSRRGNLLRRN